MYTINFTGCNSKDNPLDSSLSMDENTVNIKATYAYSPTWYELSQNYLKFLRANGYVFAPDARIEIVEDDQESTVGADEDIIKYETVPKESSNRGNKKKASK